jgi:hypothetical protein
MSDPSEFDRDTILQRKAEARIERANLPFGEKIRIVEGLRERMKPFRAIRERLDRARKHKLAREGADDTSLGSNQGLGL